MGSTGISGDLTERRASHLWYVYMSVVVVPEDHSFQACVHTKLLCELHTHADVSTLHYTDMTETLLVLGVYPRVLSSFVS